VAILSSWSFQAIFSLLYLAIVGSALAFVAYFWLLKRPIVTIILGWTFLGETAGIRTLIEATFVVVGIVIVII